MAGLGVSLGIHAAVLFALSLIVYNLNPDSMKMIVDSVFTEERPQEEFTQEIETDSEIAETMNVIAGGAISDTIAGANSTGPVVAQQKIDAAESLKEPEISVNASEITLPGVAMLSNDLGAGEVTGESGRVVEGYGAAMGQITQELVRLMREQKVLAVWLFDKSGESMKDDVREIREKFHKVYEELGIAERQDAKLKLTEEPILTSIWSFGQGFEEHTKQPTAKIPEIRAAIDQIGEDPSGKENICQTITAAVGKYTQMAQRSRRKLVIIVASDESGDDGNLVEETIDRCKKVDASVYVLGRYACFGYPYARLAWKDPKYGLTHWIQMNRGPETPFPECLQFDGLHERWDFDSSGFGPYEQVRMARETGGIFFLLPSTEDNLVGQGSLEDRKFELLDMKEYLPDLTSRQAYARSRDSSKFRAGMWAVINGLNPHQDAELRMREHWYPADYTEFATEGARNFQMAVRAMGLLNESLKALNAIEPMRASEPSQRWRAHYDLMHAQVLAYRVRLFQFLLALDKHQKEKPMPKGMNNRWNLVRVPEMLPLDDAQAKITKTDLNELNAQLEKAKGEFAEVVKNHPRTPWARRAAAEMRAGYGMKFVDTFRDPRYDTVGKDIKLPNG
ncbi:MAG: VWA domain-containing protein [Planctomycetaceae bacterium]|nr:VWA domain-containing protein [Planctomycetaceae bacterium]